MKLTSHPLRNKLRHNNTLNNTLNNKGNLSFKKKAALSKMAA